MAKDEKFEMTWPELLELLGKRDAFTVEAVDVFVSIVREGVDGHPHGDLHDFLSSMTAMYAALVTSRDVVNLGDPRDFFRACGFDEKSMDNMLIEFELGVKIDRKLKAVEAAEERE